MRSALSLIHPLSSSRYLRQQVQQEQQKIDGEKTLRRFSVGDPVLYRDILHKTWHRGTVQETSDKLYVIAAENGEIVKKHLDHVVKSTSVPENEGSGEVKSSRIDQKRLIRAGEPDETAGRSSLLLDGHSARPTHESTPKITRSSLVQENGVTRPSEASSSRAPDAHPINREASVTDARPRRVARPPERLTYSKLGGQ